MAEWKIRSESNLCAAIVVGGRDWLRRWKQYIDFNRHDETFAPPLNQSESHWLSVFMSVSHSVYTSKYFFFSVCRFWFYLSWMRAFARAISPLFTLHENVLLRHHNTEFNLIALGMQINGREKFVFVLVERVTTSPKAKKKHLRSNQKPNKKNLTDVGAIFATTQRKENMKTAPTLILCERRSLGYDTQKIPKV